MAAAVVGGAVEGAGVKVPVITGTGRQVAAGLVGVLMLILGLSSRWLPLARAGVAAARDWSERRVVHRGPHPDAGVAPKASEHFIGREAELPTVFHGDLASLAEFLELPQREQADQEVVISGVVRWLARHDRWLLVIDNLDGDTVEQAEQRLPWDLPGHVLITSQRPIQGTASRP